MLDGCFKFIARLADGQDDDNEVATRIWSMSRGGGLVHICRALNSSLCFGDEEGIMSMSGMKYYTSAILTTLFKVPSHLSISSDYLCLTFVNGTLNYLCLLLPSLCLVLITGM